MNCIVEIVNDKHELINWYRWETASITSDFDWISTLDGLLIKDSELFVKKQISETRNKFKSIFNFDSIVNNNNEFDFSKLPDNLWKLDVTLNVWEDKIIPAIDTIINIHPESNLSWRIKYFENVNCY